MSDIQKLLDIMASLRDRDTGCPWDVKQNFASIAPYTIEEAYEVADAIARENMDDLRDELGDLLLQVVFHARMAEEDCLFNFGDVVDGISEKMIRRHPHVFGSDEERAAGIKAGSWEKIKADERVASGDASVMAGIAKAMPALMRAEKLGKRASDVGFDWPDREGVRDKIQEELHELESAVGTRSAESIEEEFGDLLFAVVNMARHLKIDPENALSGANHKFERRFRDMESAIDKSGKRFRDFNLETLDKFWRKAKGRVG